MESVKSARPITSRPLSSARGMVNTGLTAPKSSRGRTALRRQVQDKSYFLGILRSKINEINTEKNVLLRESEIMSKEEARIGVYRQKAETLAKELDDYSLELAAYNEFLERIRIGDDAEALLEDTNQMKRENEALVATLESDFAKLREYENIGKKNDAEIQEISKMINSIKDRFTEAQRSEFDSLLAANNELSNECHRLENEIGLWKAKKSEFEQKLVKEDSLLKLDLLQSLSKLKELEKQKTELSLSGDSEENERAHLLAQVKRDNNYIATLEAKIEQLNQTMKEIESEINFFKDGEKRGKFADLKEKEKKMEESMARFEVEKNDSLNKIETLNNEINDMSNKLSRHLKYVANLKELTDDTKLDRRELNQLVIRKRKLELEVYRSEQLKAKVDSEREVLAGKLAKLQESIDSISDVSMVKKKIETELAKVSGEIEKSKQEIEELKLNLEARESEVREVRLELERSDSMRKLTELEDQLREVLKLNQELKCNDSEEMLLEIKSIVMENIKKYNQNLMGF